MLRVHVPENLKTFKCKTCGKAFSRENLLAQHLKIYHIKNEDKKFECYKCGRR